MILEALVRRVDQMEDSIVTRGSGRLRKTIGKRIKKRFRGTTEHYSIV